MKLLQKLFYLICVFFSLFSTQAFAQNSQLIGLWITEVKSHVKIAQCDEGLCGYVTKVAIRPELYNKHKKEIDAVGVQNAFDYFNKDPELKTRRLLGLQILTLNTKEADNIYSGEVYNPEDGKTYSGKMELINNNQLSLTGCVFLGLLCRSENWFRIAN